VCTDPNPDCCTNIHSGQYYADTDHHSDPQRNRLSNEFRDRNSNSGPTDDPHTTPTTTYSYSYRYQHSHCDPKPHTNQYTNGHSDENGNTEPHSHRHRNADSYHQTNHSRENPLRSNPDIAETLGAGRVEFQSFN
jgi:hypothetical protein